MKCFARLKKGSLSAFRSRGYDSYLHKLILRYGSYLEFPFSLNSPTLNSHSHSEFNSFIPNSNYKWLRNTNCRSEISLRYQDAASVPTQRYQGALRHHLTSLRRWFGRRAPPGRPPSPRAWAAVTRCADVAEEGRR